MNADDVTELLRDMRREAGLTGSELGQRLGLALNPDRTSCPQVSKYENGVKVPKWDLFGRWAAACGFHAELVVTPKRGAPWIIPLNDKVTS